MAKVDETDLVDVKEFPSEEDVTEARDQAAFAGRFNRGTSEPSATERDADTDVNTENDGEDPFAMQMAPAKPGQTTVASLRERLAAFLVDLGVLWLLFWGCLFVFHKFTLHSWIGPVPTMGTVAMFFHGSFLLLAFLYFFLFESAFFATIGKFCCWMYVRRKDGHHAGVFSIFIRNFFRLGELVTGGLLTWVPMEITRRHQRFGDMAAGTIVIKRHSAGTRYYGLDADLLASAFGRLFAQIIDLALVLIWMAGYVLLINYQSIILSQWLVLLFPLVTIFFWTLVQVILETTPGLWLLGYTITHEDGGRLTLAGALFRVLMAPLDLLFGLPCMLLSLRKQKIGDLLAATVVSCQPRRWKGAIGSLVVIASCVGIVALGLFINPLNNVFKARSEFRLNFLPTVEGLPDWEAASSSVPQVLTLRNFRFGVNDPNTRRTPPVYEPGETVFLLFEISGYTRRDRLVWIQEDLMVQYPNGTIGLKQENVVDYHQIVKPGGSPIELSNNVALPATAAPGTYVVTVTLRDKLADNFTVTETQSFTVKAPASMTSPLEAAPTAPSALPPFPMDRYSPPPTGEGQGEGEAKAKTPSPVPSSPIPVMPMVPSDQYGAKSVAPAAVTPTPSGGFTTLPGPSIAPKQEATPAPTIPIPPPSPSTPSPLVGEGRGEGTKSTPSSIVPPADQYGSKPAAPGAAVPAPLSTPPAAATTPVTPPPTTPAIVEKTLAPTVKPIDQYGAAPSASAAAAPVDTYAKPATPAATATPKAESTKATKTVTPKAAAKTATPKPAATPAPPPAASPARPAADIPSAAAVKAQDQQDATTPKPKKKKASSDSGSSGGYMP